MHGEDLTIWNMLMANDGQARLVLTLPGHPAPLIPVCGIFASHHRQVSQFLSHKERGTGGRQPLSTPLSSVVPLQRTAAEVSRRQWELKHSVKGV